MKAIMEAFMRSKQFVKLWLKDGRIFAQRAGGPPIWIEYNAAGFYVVYVDRAVTYSSAYPAGIIKAVVGRV